MPKINQEEYEVLKEKSSGGYEWIARDESGSCFVFELKPIKDHRYELWEWVGSTRIGKIFNSSLFQFIQWEDSEPHNIAELIEEYENEEFGYHIMEAARDYEQFVKESEETEVKKDVEWLKEKIKEEHEYNRAKHNKEGFEGYAHREFVFKYVLNLINQLDEPEVLSSDWVDGNKEPFHHFETKKVDYYVSADLLQNLLVPKQEEITEEQAWEVLSELYEIPNKSYIREAMRVVANYVGDDMTIGELKERISKPTVPPQKYQVKDNHGRTILAKMTYSYKGKTFEEVQSYNELILGYEKELTEQEIKDYDERFWPFAVPVEEMEE